MSYKTQSLWMTLKTDNPHVNLLIFINFSGSMLKHQGWGKSKEDIINKKGGNQLKGAFRQWKK